jgi:hypothetical protein
VRYAVELHDSVLHAVRMLGRDVVLELRPAYVHRWEAGAATGWVQDVDIVVSAAALERTTGGSLPVRLLDGQVRAGGAVHDNLIPLPLRAADAVRVSLEGPGELHLGVEGASIEVRARGAARYVEPSPWDGG